MMMKKWWLASNQSNKHTVKVNQLKLELGLFGVNVATTVNDKLAIEITWIKKCNENSSSSFSCMIPFHRTLKPPCSHITPCRRFVAAGKTPSHVWDNHDLCAFNLGLKDICHVTFNVLYGQGGGEESKGKMVVVGKVCMTLAMEEMKTESNVQRKLPIRLKVNGLIIEATLLVCLRLLLKLRNNSDYDSAITFENTVKSDKKLGTIEKGKYLTCLIKKKNGKFDEHPYESDGSPVFDSDESSNESTTSGGSSSSSSNSPTESRVNFPSSGIKTSLDSNRRFKGWDFKTGTAQLETSTIHQTPFTKSDELSLRSNLQGNSSKWEMKYILSRDGQSKLKTNVFFASFDQRSEKASGESACTVLVALISHWLHSNQGIPTRTQFDNLITQGSSEWRKLCKNDYYSKHFPDKHFDLETVIDANLRPLVVLPQKSYTGFFSPEKFHCLEGAMSFDEIWNEINNINNKNTVVDFEPRIYIVSWNDHFFILKVEVDAYYIIDSLGERLFEGCQRAFVLKFDDSCVMYGKVDKNEEEVNKDVGTKSSSRGEESFEIVFRGKECCKEFIKRFLAAISVRQLEKEEKKWSVSNPYLHRQLQIDFHFSSPLSFSTSSMLYFLTNEHLEA